MGIIDSFINLHVHSMYSLNDSIIRPDELMTRLKELGQTAVAITDHGNMYAGVHIYKLCKENNIKYIHGCEFYICDDVKIKDKDRPYYHLIVLCKNEQGRLNLNKLVSLSELPDNFYYKPRIDFELLKAHKDGLIVCSACLAGELAKFISATDIADTDNRGEAVARAIRYKQTFGDDYYVEIQSHNDKDQIAVNKELVRLAEENGIEVVVTTDAHYTWEKDRQYQNIYAFGGKYKEDGESYVDCFMQSEQEVRDRLRYLPQEIVDKAIRNTQVIADKCNVELPLSAPIMPKVETPPEYKDNLSWLQEICRNGCRQKLGFDIDTLEDVENPTVPREERQKYKDRYEYEMDSLSRMGFVDYTLLVYSYANVGKRRGKGRGSGGGSLVNYFSNITDVDPIEHGLFFERYVDVSALGALERGEITAKELKIPDIDLDFSGEDCKKVLKWIYDKYGEEKVASIGKFGTNKTKGCVRDLCRNMGIDLTTADVIAKSFEDFQIEDLDAIIEANEKLPANMQTAYEFTQQYPKLFDYVRKLSGLPKSFGLHACGKVIAVQDLDYYLPSCYDDNGIRYLQGEMHDVEDVGLVKVDVLGLRTLDHEYDALELSGNGEEFINPKQKYDDDKVWKIFRDGDTEGIFQFSSNGMKETLRKMQASSIHELAVANALFRPGAMAHIDEYCNRKHGKEAVTYYHPDLEPILKDTYGIIVFQEQLILIARLAKMRNPDILRKLVGKKSAALIPVVKPELHDGLVARGWAEEQFNLLWDVIIASCNYMFNRSHAMAYAILAYMTAKLKAYHPAEFYAGLLSSYISSGDINKDSDKYFADIARHKITFEPFSFRNDHRKCSVKDGKIVYALPLVRDMNTETAEILYKNRDFKGDYFFELLFKLYEDGLRKSALSKLISLDMFSEFGNSRQLQLMLDTCEFIKWGEKEKMLKKTAAKNAELDRIISNYSTDLNAKGEVTATYSNIKWDDVLIEYEMKVRAAEIPDVNIKVKVVNQKEMIGLAPFPTGRDEDRSLLFVTDVKPLCNKTTGNQFGYSVFTSSFGSGIRARFTVKGKQYKEWDKNPIQQNDIIRCLGWQSEKGFFTLTSWKQIYV